MRIKLSFDPAKLEFTLNETCDIHFQRKALDHTGSRKVLRRVTKVGVQCSNICSLVVGDTVQDIMGMLLLMSAQNPVHVLVDVFRCFNLQARLTCVGLR